MMTRTLRRLLSLMEVLDNGRGVTFESFRARWRHLYGNNYSLHRLNCLLHRAIANGYLRFNINQQRYYLRRRTVLTSFLRAHWTEEDAQNNDQNVGLIIVANDANVPTTFMTNVNVSPPVILFGSLANNPGVAGSSRGTAVVLRNSGGCEPADDGQSRQQRSQAAAVVTTGPAVVTTGPSTSSGSQRQALPQQPQPSTTEGNNDAPQVRRNRFDRSLYMTAQTLSKIQSQGLQGDTSNKPDDEVSE